MKNESQKIMDKFDGSRRLRPWSNSHFGGMEAVKAHPLQICRLRPNEGGSFVTRLHLNLAPVSGYMRTKAYAQVMQVFVPYQAIEKLELDSQDDAGVTEMSRRRLMAGQGIGLEEEGTISKAANVHPKNVGGTKSLNKSVRLAYLAAVNHMRLSAYFGSALVDKSETAILPAILSANVLQRFQGVLEPETHVDGAINLTGKLGVKGIGAHENQFVSPQPPVVPDGEPAGGDWTRDQTNVRLREDPDNPGKPLLTVDLDGTSEITLRDMVQSQKLDEIVRHFAMMIQKDPVNGEELVERAMYNISVDYDHNCQVLYDQTYELQAEHHRPMDGASINDVSGHFEIDDTFATLVPRSELGGQLVTICMVKPVEVLRAQPDPAQCEAWELVNIIHDETELDEKLLTRKDLERDVGPANADTPTFWVGHNALEHGYSTQGVNDQQTFEVEMNSSMWTYEIPTGVTPENVSYPDGGIDMYPFFNWNGAQVEYHCEQRALISTSLAKGPTPVERIQLFADDPSLIDDDA